MTNSQLVTSYHRCRVVCIVLAVVCVVLGANAVIDLLLVLR